MINMMDFLLGANGTALVFGLILGNWIIILANLVALFFNFVSRLLSVDAE